MTKGMVCAPQPEAVEAGAFALKRGGNAVDAAMTCALVQTVVDPMMCGIAGFGTMQLYLPSKNHHGFIDFHTTAPEAATETMWQDQIKAQARDGFGFILHNRANECGYESIMTPGSLKAYYEAVQEYGTFDWKDIIQPAIEHAEDGFVIRPHVDEFWTAANVMGRMSVGDKLREIPATREIYCDQDGNTYPVGSRVKNPGMKQTLERIRDGGAEIFYSGEIAEEIAADVAAHNGLLSLDDLKNYKTVRAEPIWGEYRGDKVSCGHPPGGGVMILEMLNILEHFDLGAMTHNSADYIAIVAEAMKYATIDKDNKMGDPAFDDVPIKDFIDRQQAGRYAHMIRSGEKANVIRFGEPEESKDTTHVTVVDDAGNCVSMTHSLGMPSGVVTKGMGFMYNGCMGAFDPRPGMPHSIGPGKRRFTAMCPTIVFKGDDPYVVIGAPGGTFITMGVLQAVLNVLDFDMTMLEAVAAPRFTANSNTIDVSNRIPHFVTRELEARGYPIVRNPFSYVFAGVHGIRLPKDGKRQWDGGADPGRDGIALEV
ncbi:MAG: gamma-glutamyltransferase [Rhodospirillaceae bacterium]|jgi:gamma-glutamyltranspeptidase/glutathione hydrolase|nr:gamma-glutamyltransferase [Rhodospirillaceae bacterium]MBT3493981.1 gamma-glutamyltransferase [Rhodospirillaceae bacterium]MBT3778897.1 gamma-glutamyltransferase [Rhodospirillaceae bacterium]MBT3975705.1 gamma-glutamyltransferase [Rhodospirillaceae bacterium]MBT4168124.1 gamma-glutamyltransferase [Rhodospirillaceae bacterium]